jgi:hypothetical protein
MRASALAAAGIGLVAIGSLGPSSDVAETLQTSLGALLLVVALDQRPALLGTGLLVGPLPRRALARLVVVAGVAYGLVPAIDWALAERFDAFSLAVVALALALAAASLFGWRPPRPGLSPRTRASS